MLAETELREERHVALFIPSVAAGGAERILVRLASGFAARGYRVDLVLANADGPFTGEVSASVRIVDLGCRRVLTSLFPLVRYLKTNRPDALLSAMTHANVIAIWAKLLGGSCTRLGSGPIDLLEAAVAA